MEQNLKELTDRFDKHVVRDEKNIKEIMSRLDDGDIRMTSHGEALNRIESAMAELLGIFHAGEGFFKVMGWIGKGIKWLIVTGAGVGVIWAFLSGSAPHK